jgi:hypothetical protein
MTAAASAPRRILFVHQNFPGQFVHVAAELARLGHEVVALGVTPRAVPGVRIVSHAPAPPARETALPPLRDFEVKVVRGLSALGAFVALRDEGFVPDVVVAHPAWGEALFCKDVWPGARLLVFSEFFYSADGADAGFDPEFAHEDLAARVRLRLKNTVHLHGLHAADAGYAPTRWQRDQVPAEYRDKLEVVFDGIDTARVAPCARCPRCSRRGRTRTCSSSAATMSATAAGPRAVARGGNGCCRRSARRCRPGACISSASCPTPTTCACCRCRPAMSI